MLPCPSRRTGGLPLLERKGGRGGMSFGEGGAGEGGWVSVLGRMKGAALLAEGTEVMGMMA